MLFMIHPSISIDSTINRISCQHEVGQGWKIHLFRHPKIR